MKPTFISSSPLGSDLLEGKAQEQIAKSISQLIKNDNMKTRLVGLDGGWGSGKSNLIKIIEQKLKKSHHTFLYDAWGHQEDLQRRAFLEELTENVSSNSVVDSEKWGKKLKELLSRKRETVTKTIPRLSYGIIITLLITVLTPIAKTISESVDNIYWKLLITSSPLLLGIAIWLIISWKRGYLLTFNDIYFLYKNKDLTNETHVTISEKEPSVKEFQGWMNDLSKDLEKKKLIIVFDNMDRLPPEKVRELWSSIHTFFAEQSFDNIWVIIPFDREHISDAFENKIEISDQFLEKSFSIIYRVSPPVLTDWQKFFDMKFEEAFCQKQYDDLATIRRIFGILQHNITPRNIISFMNEMVSLRLVVEEDILLKYIAIFVLTKKDILKAPVDQILSLKFLKEAHLLFQDDQELPNHIAALVYHVPLASASQVSLTREIQNSLQNVNTTRINELAKHIHFIDILEQVIENEDFEIPNTVSTLDALDGKFIEPPNNNKRMQEIWDFLCDEVSKITMIEQTFSNTHELLIKNCSNKKVESLVEYLISEFREIDIFQGDAYFIALSSLSKYLDELKSNIKISIKTLKTTPENYVNYLKVAKKDFKKYKLECDASELKKYLIGKSPDDLKGLEVLSVINNDFDFKEIIDGLVESVKNKVLTVENFEPFYNFYKAITKDKPIEILEDDQIHNLLTQIEEDSEGYYDLLAMRLSRVSSFPGFGGITQSILTNTDDNLVKKIAERIEYFDTYGNLLLEFISWKQPLLKEVLKDLTLNSYGTAKIDIVSILEQFENLHTSLDLTPRVLLKRFNAWIRFAKEEITPENVTDVIQDFSFFEYAINIENELTRHIIEMMVTHMKTISLGDWGTALRDEESYLSNVSYWLLDGGQLKTLPDNAISAYKSILVDIAKGDFTIDDQAVWDLYYSRINKNKLKSTVKNIRDLFISEISITPYLFLWFSEMLINHGDLKKRSADVTRKILTPVASDATCLEFIIDNDEVFIPLINEAGDDAYDFKDIIRQKILETDVAEKITSFAKSIDVDGESGPRVEVLEV